MRQSAQQVDESVSWKQEVNRRVAEHIARKTAGINTPQASAGAPPASGSRAAAAAARVAARYAKTPSYSDMLAGEARAAVRAAEAASKAALEAQAAAEQVLAGLEARSSAAPAWEVEFFTPVNAEPAAKPDLGLPAPEPALSQAAPATAQAANAAQPLNAAQASSAAQPRPSFEIRWDADMPLRESRPAPGRASHRKAAVERAAEGVGQAPELGNALHTDGYEVVEAALPIHANLIEFPRELVATRKVRPRRAEGPYAELLEQQGQLSIFEVDPRSVSTEPAASGVAVEAGAAIWVEPEWSGIELDEHPEEVLAIPDPVLQPLQRKEQEVAPELQQASMNRRVLAALVDFSLIASAFLAAALLALMNLRVLPSIKQMEMGSAEALALTAMLYLGLFFLLAKATPGMKYAQLEICTLRGVRATRARRCGRMAAMFLSLLPMGMGVALALFDEQHLCWHDRLSGTYLRKA